MVILATGFFLDFRTLTTTLKGKKAKKLQDVHQQSYTTYATKQKPQFIAAMRKEIAQLSHSTAPKVKERPRAEARPETLMLNGDLQEHVEEWRKSTRDSTSATRPISDIYWLRSGN